MQNNLFCITIGLNQVLQTIHFIFSLSNIQQVFYLDSPKLSLFKKYILVLDFFFSNFVGLRYYLELYMRHKHFISQMTHLNPNMWLSFHFCLDRSLNYWLFFLFLVDNLTENKAMFKKKSTTVQRYWLPVESSVSGTHMRAPPTYIHTTSTIKYLLPR